MDYDYYLYLKEHENDDAAKTAETTDKAASEAVANTTTTEA